MSDREQLELLVSRQLDGDLTASEQRELEAALAGDAELRALSAELSRVHSSINLLSEQRLPSDFTSRILSGIEKVEPAGAPVRQLPTASYRHWAAAAAILMVLGLLVTATVINKEGKPAGDGKLAFDTPLDPTRGAVGPRVAPYTGPTTQMVAFSDGELEVVSGAKTQTGKQLEGEFALPATISAPVDTHAVVSVNGGTVVLSPGAKARLIEGDADGLTDFEPLDGDMYFESKAQGLRSQVAGQNLDVDGGLTLRHTADGYIAELSHGGAYIGEQQFAFRECALINADGANIRPCEMVLLDDWAIRGRVDAIKQQMRILIGDQFDQIPPEFWTQWDKFLRGMLSQPWQSATVAYSIRFMLKYEFFEETTETERQVFSTIGDIISEGTTEQDVPVQIMEMFRGAEERFDENPQELENFKRTMRKYFERMAEFERRNQGE